MSENNEFFNIVWYFWRNKKIRILLQSSIDKKSKVKKKTKTKKLKDHIQEGTKVHVIK